jgi:hypothetical protein
MSLSSISNTRRRPEHSGKLRFCRVLHSYAMSANWLFRVFFHNLIKRLRLVPNRIFDKKDFRGGNEKWCHVAAMYAECWDVILAKQRPPSCPTLPGALSFPSVVSRCLAYVQVCLVSGPDIWQTRTASPSFYLIHNKNLPRLTIWSRPLPDCTSNETLRQFSKCNATIVSIFVLFIETSCNFTHFVHIFQYSSLVDIKIYHHTP